jgi:predicted nucleotidyltransferase
MKEQMISFKQIHEIAVKIIDEFHPERIVLFGSYARGEETTYSDIDLLVIMPSFPGKNVLKAIEIIKRIRPAIPMDLLVRTSDQVRRRLAMNDYFIKEIIEKGAVLYEVDHARMA